MKLQPSVLITIITAAIAFGGFYYTTGERLDSLEAKLEKLEKRIKVKKRKAR